MKTPDYYLKQKSDHRSQLFMPKELWREMWIVAARNDMTAGQLICAVMANLVCPAEEEVQDEKEETQEG